MKTTVNEFSEFVVYQHKFGASSMEEASDLAAASSKMAEKKKNVTVRQTTHQ